MRLKKYYQPVVLYMAMLMALGCNKSGDAVPVVAPVSKLNIINAVTDIRAIDFYLNGTRQNNGSAIFLFNSSGYLNVPTGEQQYQFKSDTDRTILADIKLSPAKTDSSYTLVLAGQQNKNTLTPIFLNDNFITDPIATNARVRFVQASPGVSVYDVFVGDTLSFKNQGFKSLTGFKSVGAGKKTVRINLAGTTTQVYTGTAILQSNGYYTMYTSGAPGGTLKNALNVSVNLNR